MYGLFTTYRKSAKSNFCHILINIRYLRTRSGVAHISWSINDNSMLDGECGTCSDQYLTVDRQLVLYVIYLFIYLYIRGGAGKSLARPTSWCRRTELIVSLERGVCSCTELQVFSCYKGWKEAYQATHVISTTWWRELSSSFFFLQGKAPKEIHAILTETLACFLPGRAKDLSAPLYLTLLVDEWNVSLERE